VKKSGWKKQQFEALGFLTRMNSIGNFSLALPKHYREYYSHHQWNLMKLFGALDGLLFEGTYFNYNS
jgi:hypothetical protein